MAIIPSPRFVVRLDTPGSGGAILAPKKAVAAALATAAAAVLLAPGPSPPLVAAAARLEKVEDAGPSSNATRCVV